MVRKDGVYTIYLLQTKGVGSIDDWFNASLDHFGTPHVTGDSSFWHHPKGLTSLVPFLQELPILGIPQRMDLVHVGTVGRILESREHTKKTRE